MTTKTYSTKSNAKRAGVKQYGNAAIKCYGTEGAWYYAPPTAEADAASAPQDTADVQAAVLRNLVAATNQVALAALQADAPKAPVKRAAVKRTPVAPPAPTKATTKAVAKTAPKAPAKAAAKKVAKPVPTSKEIAAAYPSGVQKLKANETRGKNKSRTSTGYKLQKERPENHGVQCKSVGTVGQQLWAIYDKLLTDIRKKVKAAGAKDLSLGNVRDAGIKAGFNSTTVALAFYQWRRFHGVRGRGKKQKVD